MSDQATLTESETEFLEAEPSEESIDRHTAGEEVVADDDAPDVRSIEYQRQRRRESVERMSGPITRYDGPSMTRPGDMPQNVGLDREKLAARANERSVPAGVPDTEKVAWVNRDPERAHALALSEHNREDGNSDLAEFAATYAGTDGADVRAERDAAYRGVDVRRSTTASAHEEAKGR